MKFIKEMLLLYAVTDRSWEGKLTLYEQIEHALLGGVTMVQLREKEMSRGELLSQALKVKELCHRYGVPLIINDDAEVALMAGADGVHVGIEDCNVCDIRKKAPENFIIGATAKTVEQARNAETEGADYLGIGAVFPSPTKKNAVRITVDRLKEITASVTIPTVAIGGITLENMSELKDGGMQGIATVSAIFAADDIKKQTSLLRKKAEDIINGKGDQDENSIVNCRQ